MSCLFLSGRFFPTLKSHTTMNSFKCSLKRETDGISRFVVCYLSRVVFLFVYHAQYEVSLTNYLPFVVGGFKICALLCVGFLVRVCCQGSAMLYGYLSLMRCCNGSITRRLAAPQRCIISVGVFEVDSEIYLVDISGKCIVGGGLFYP